MKSPGMVLVLLILAAMQVNAQVFNDSLANVASGSASNYTDKELRFSATKLILPATFITYGVLSMTSGTVKNLNGSTFYEINEHQPRHLVLDNYTQYAPAVLVYALNLSGIKGEHDFGDRTIIYATSQLITAAIVLPMKNSIKEMRPDGSDNLSFPSGHTATAFSSAQFMFREYRRQNFWLSISGYPFAVFTGVYRSLNNKHWVGDVVAGAGIGILSTELAYWLFPKTSLLFGKKKIFHDMSILPNYYHSTIGITLVKVF